MQHLKGISAVLNAIPIARIDTRSSLMESSRRVRVRAPTTMPSIPVSLALSYVYTSKGKYVVDELEFMNSLRLQQPLKTLLYV